MLEGVIAGIILAAIYALFYIFAIYLASAILEIPVEEVLQNMSMSEPFYMGDVLSPIDSYIPPIIHPENHKKRE